MAKTARTRIVNVRPKAGNVVVFENPRIQRGRDVSERLSRAGKRMSEAFPDDMAGYTIVAWDTQGGWHSAMCTNNTFMSEGIAIEFARTCLLRRLAEDDTIERLGYDPDAC